MIRPAEEGTRMNQEELRTLAERIEGAAGPDLDLAVAALKGLRSALPEAEPDLRAGVVESTDMALHLVARRLPNWSVALEGAAREPDGRWTCTLRSSEVRDDEEVIGIGRAPTAALAVLAALLRVAAIQAKGYR
jgi:hypothetical protein